MKLWVARDINNDLAIYEYEPILIDNEFYYLDYKKGFAFDIPKHLFPEVTFEKSPQQVEFNLLKLN